MTESLPFVADSQLSSLRHFALQNLAVILGGSIFLLLIKSVGTAIYNVYFHPLSNYPGPKLAAATSLVIEYVQVTGILCRWAHKQHEQYGEVVRLGPDKLSYISPDAWKDIYGHRVNGKRQENSKDARFYQPEYNGEHHMVSYTDVAEHARVRKIFTHAFSDKALKLQEPLIKSYIDQLISNMHTMVEEDSERELDLVTLFNCVTFDIMGDLAFGEPLGLLTESALSPWVKAIFGGLKYMQYSRLALEYPLLGYIMGKLLAPRSLINQRKAHWQFTVDRVNRRIAKGNNKPDIWNLVLAKGLDTMSLAQMHANASTFMIAGTETTASLLCGLTYLFLMNPETLKKAVEEVRSLPSEDELNLESLARLKYLAICFEEAMRIYPSVPGSLPREVPQGGNMICGDWIPDKTQVTVNVTAAHRSSLNFKDPLSFIPERWLPGYGYDDDRKDACQPFSYGPRNCVGKNLAYHEMRIIMAKVLWHFDLELSPDCRDWIEQRSYFIWEKPALWVKAKAVQRD